MPNIMDNPELTKMFEVDLDRIIMVGHKQGITYPRIFYCILHRLEQLVLECLAEEWFKDRE